MGHHNTQDQWPSLLLCTKTCGPLRSHQQEVQYAPGLIVQRGYDGSRPESSSDMRLATCEIQGDVLDVKTHKVVKHEAWGDGDTNTKHVRHIAASNVRSVCAENRNKR
jgi:hypothetical protein